MLNTPLLNKARNIANILTKKTCNLLLKVVAPSDLAKFNYIPRLHFSTRPNSNIIAFDYAIVSRDRLNDLPSSELFFVLNAHTKRFLMATRAGESEYVNQLEANYVENKLIMHKVEQDLITLQDLITYVKTSENEDTLYSNSLESYMYKHAVQYLTKIKMSNK